MRQISTIGEIMEIGRAIKIMKNINFIDKLKIFNFTVSISIL